MAGATPIYGATLEGTLQSLQAAAPSIEAGIDHIADAVYEYALDRPAIFSEQLVIPNIDNQVVPKSARLISNAISLSSESLVDDTNRRLIAAQETVRVRRIGHRRMLAAREDFYTFIAAQVATPDEPNSLANHQRHWTDLQTRFKSLIPEIAIAEAVQTKAEHVGTFISGIIARRSGEYAMYSAWAVERALQQQRLRDAQKQQAEAS